jgi:Polysaccharide deacetylase
LKSLGGLNLIVFSIDIDWAPDEVIADTVELFEKYGIRATIFATNRSDVLLNCNREMFEVGLHLNFDPLLVGAGGNIDKVIDELWAEYPEAKGVRCHCLMSGTRLSEAFARRGMVYEANLFVPYMTGVTPFVHWTGLISIPHVWEDDVHFSYGRDFDSSGVKLATNAIQVFSFHPVHVFLNTENQARYAAARKHYQQPAKLKECSNRGPIPGTRDLFDNLLRHANAVGEGNKTLIEIATEVRASSVNE